MFRRLRIREKITHRARIWKSAVPDPDTMTAIIFAPLRQISQRLGLMSLWVSVAPLCQMSLLCLNFTTLRQPTLQSTRTKLRRLRRRNWIISVACRSIRCMEMIYKLFNCQHSGMSLRASILARERTTRRSLIPGAASRRALMTRILLRCRPRPEVSLSGRN